MRPCVAVAREHERARAPARRARRPAASCPRRPRRESSTTAPAPPCARSRSAASRADSACRPISPAAMGASLRRPPGRVGRTTACRAGNTACAGGEKRRCGGWRRRAAPVASPGSIDTPTTRRSSPCSCTSSSAATASATPPTSRRPAARSAAEGDKPGSGVRWIRSYAIAEESGEVGTVCIYEAESPEHIRAHARASAMAADEIIPVLDTVVVRPDLPGGVVASRIAGAASSNAPPGAGGRVGARTPGCSSTSRGERRRAARRRGAVVFRADWDASGGERPSPGASSSRRGGQPLRGRPPSGSRSGHRRQRLCAGYAPRVHCPAP